MGPSPEVRIHRTLKLPLDPAEIAQPTPVVLTALLILAVRALDSSENSLIKKIKKVINYE